MNQKTKSLPLLIALLGILGWLTRLAMYRIALDGKGLLVENHPIRYLLLALLLGAAAVIALPRKESPAPLAGPLWLPAAGSFALSAGLVSVAMVLEPVLLPEKICRVLALLAAFGQFWAAFSHLRGQEPSFLCGSSVSLFFLLFAVGRYSYWSGDPHTHHFLFFAAGMILMALTGYCRAAFAAKLGWGKHHMGLSLAAAFACLTGIPESGFALLLVCAAFWALTGLYRPYREV